MIRDNIACSGFLGYNIDTGGNKFLSFGLGLLLSFKKINSEDTVMPPRREKICMCWGVSPSFPFIKTVQIQNYPWVSTKTKMHVRVFS